MLNERLIQASLNPTTPPTTTDEPHSFRVDPIKPNTIYLCLLCGDVAQLPRLKQHTFHLPFGIAWTVDWQTPMVCATCRMMRHPEVVKLGDGRRRFWKRAVALYLGETYPSAGPKMNRVLYWRNWIAFRLRRTDAHLRAIGRVWRGR